jgi:hypothetical protein
MKSRGVPACSVEINPYLHFVGTIKTRSYSHVEEIDAEFDRIIAALRLALSNVPFESTPTEYLAEYANDIPESAIRQVVVVRQQRLSACDGR